MSREVKWLYDAYKCHRDADQFKQYCNLKRSYRNFISHKKKIFNDSLIINARNKTKEAWNLINKTVNVKKSKILPLVANVSGTASIMQLANKLNNSFIQQPVLNASVLQPHIPTRDNASAVPHSMFLRPCCPSELSRYLSKVGNKKSSGLDGIPGSLLKDCGDAIKEPLLYLINQSLLLGEFPDILKISKVIPVYKNKGDKYSINNYRPISLLSQFSKILESVYCTRLMEFLEKHNVISQSQFGFRKGKSTAQAIFSAVDFIVEQLNNSHAALGISFDLTNAFNSVDHELLLRKCDILGIRGVAYCWLKSYLSNRQQVVELCKNGKRYNSDIQCVSTGVPQGSILGPVLFLIFVNDLPGSLLHKGRNNVVMYADDVNFLSGQLGYNGLMEVCNETLVRMSQWCWRNKLYLNEKKTQLLFFSASTRGLHKLHACIDADLQLGDRANFLGVLIDPLLNWSHHIENLSKKLNSAYYLLSTVKHSLSTEVLKSVYYAYFFSYVSYCIVVWGSSPLLNDIFRLQKKIVRSMCNVHYRSHCRPLFKKLDLLTVPSIYIFCTLVFTRENLSLFSNNKCYHEHNTRKASNLHVSQQNLRLSSLGPRSMCIKVYNALPVYLKNITTMSAFKCHLRRYLMTKCLYSVQEYFLHC
jgi:hypothetical protein